MVIKMNKNGTWEGDNTGNDDANDNGIGIMKKVVVLMTAVMVIMFLAY